MTATRPIEEMVTVRGTVDHYARRGLAGLTGSWAGEERPEPE